MNPIENFFLDLGLSWTISKLLPYIIVVLIGGGFVFLFKNKLKGTKRIIRVLLKLLVFVAPFLIYFIFSPIYQGDFANNSAEIKKTENLSELTGKKLVVISMPQCPHCYSSIDRVLKLKERIPSAEIEYIVCTMQEDERYLEWYQEKGGQDISVKFADSAMAMTNVAKGRFPTFVLVNNNKSLKVWSNDDFGVSAMDEVELFLK